MPRASTAARTEGRASALWGASGRGGRRGRLLVLAVLALLVGLPTGAHAAAPQRAWVAPTLYADALAHPAATFDVVVRAVPGDSSGTIANDFSAAAGRVKRRFSSISGVAGTLSGAQLVKLASTPHVLSITPDARVATTGYVNEEQWRQSTSVSQLWGTWSSPAPRAPAIAIVDSGIDATKAADFGARVVASVNLSSLAPGATGDQQGHGTLVAGIAAGNFSQYPGVARNAPLVDVRTADADGASRTSDVIAAADWIIQHQSQYNIRVANFSLRGGVASTFRYDPLDAAVENLWFHGVVVVAAAGNYGTATGAVSVQYSPGNDPFIISVGALDTAGTTNPTDDFVAPWSAYGSTLDGFSKPDLSAPGRWLIGPVPADATLPTQAPDRIVAPGYMWMSGTSLSAPIVAGAAAQVLARRPGWTSDQVKGALIQSATRLGAVGGVGAGAGEVNAAAAAAVTLPTNPNAALDAFLVTDPTTGAVTFDSSAWTASASNTGVASQTDWTQTDWTQTDWTQTDWVQ